MTPPISTQSHRRLALLLWLGFVAVAALLTLNWRAARHSRVDAASQHVALRHDLLSAEERLRVAELASARFDARNLEAVTAPLTPDKQREEAVRAKLRELLRRHAGEPVPQQNGPPGPFYLAEHLADPAVATLYRTWWRQKMELEYNALFASLRLPPEIQARFEELLMERQLAVMDVIAATGAHRRTPSNPGNPAQRAEAGRAQAAHQAAFREELKTLLGDDNFAAFERHQKTTLTRLLAGRLATRLSYSDVPLSRDQQAQLAACTSISEFDAKARELLSPPQWERFQELERERSRNQ